MSIDELEDVEIELDILIREVNAGLTWPFQVEGYAKSDGGYIHLCDVPAYDLRNLPFYFVDLSELGQEKTRWLVAANVYYKMKSPYLPRFDDFYTEVEAMP